METKGGIKWDIKRGKDVSTWELLPVSTDGSFTGIQAGDLIFNISAGYQIDNLYAYGSEDLKLVVIHYTGSKLVLVAEPGRRSYSMDDLEEQQEGVKVTVYAEDDDTHERKALSEEMLRNLKIEFSLQGEKSKLELFTEEDSGGNSFRIYPRYYKGDPLNTDEGIYTVNCKAQTTEGEKYYTGEVQFELDIGKLSLCKHLRLIAPRLIAIGIILFILFGYVKKNRIRKKGLHPHNIAQNRKTSGDKKIKKSLLSVILPYVSEVATVRSYDSGYQCKVPDLKIKAASKSSFRIINKNLDVNTFEIDGVRYEKYQDVKKRKFSYGGFKITSIDTTTRTKLGSFVFR